MRIIVFGGLYGGPPILGNYQLEGDLESAVLSELQPVH